MTPDNPPDSTHLPPIRPRSEQEEKEENAPSSESETPAEESTKQRKLKPTGQAVVVTQKVRSGRSKKRSRDRAASSNAQEGGDPARAEQKTNTPFLKRLLLWLVGVDKVRAGLALFAIILAVLAGNLSWKSGYSSGRRAVESERLAAVEQQAAAATPETLAQLDAALGLLREEKAGRALDLFERVRGTSPELPALDYLAALAALRDGDLDRAEILAKSSAQKREREADSLVLLGVIEAQRGASDSTPRLIDPNRASLEFIARAMKVDPSSPAPRIEAANAFRSLGKNEEALAELDAARLRMLPVDLLLTVDVTRALLGVEVHGTEGPHLLPPRAGDWPSLFQGALVAMKNNDFSTALKYLEQCREGLPPMTFFYLVSDPSLRKFAFHPETRSFFQQFE